MQIQTAVLDAGFGTTLVDNRTARLICDYIPSEETLDNLSDYFSSLSDKTRIKIVSALSICPLCVGDISKLLKLNQTTVSHQLKNLKNTGVVSVKRQGKISFYCIKDKNLLEIMLTAVDSL